MQNLHQKIGLFHLLFRHVHLQQIRGCNRSHYEVLGVTKAATTKDIRRKFLELSKQLHPDISKHENTHEKFVRVSEAYSILSNPMSRREYDLTLAARLLQHQQMRSSAFGSHSFGSSPHPGGGFESGSEANNAFWDETLYHMRDQGKDKHYEDQPYYGVKGINKLPNSYIVIACAIWLVGGGILHFLAIRKSADMHKSTLDRRDQENHAFYVKAKESARKVPHVQMLSSNKRDKEKYFYTQATQAKESARVHGTAKQLEILKANIAAGRTPAASKGS